MKRIVQLRNLALLAIGMIAFSFNAVSAVVVTAPDGSEQWTIGTIQAITWTGDAGPVTIKLWDFTVPAVPVDKGIITTNGLAGSFGWNIGTGLPVTPGTHYRIQVIGSTTDDYSLDDFELVVSATLAVTAPNGGESWAIGSTQDITWSSAATGVTLIELYNGNDLVSTLCNADQNSPFAWTNIPDNIPTGSTYRIKVTRGAFFDFSNAYFTITQTIVTSPNGGEVWAGQVTHPITWTSNAVGNTIIRLFKGAGEDASSPIYNGDLGAGINTWPWLISKNLLHGTDYSIKVERGGGIDESNGDFTIAQTTVTYPTDANVVLSGQSAYNITWTTFNSSGTTTIALYLDDVLNSTIATGSLTSPYNWTVPASLAADDGYKIKVSVGSESFDFSDNPFTIHQTNITSPNGGEVWAGQNNHTITWTSTLTGNPLITIKLIKGGNEAGATLLVDNEALGNNVNTWNWTNISEGIAAGIDYKIKVDKGTGVYDYSNTNFRIDQTVVSSPGAGTFTPGGASPSIAWTSTATGTTTIELWTSAGVFSSTILPASSSQTSPFSWTIPYTTPVGDYKIKVKKGTESYDWSAVFTVASAVHVLRPSISGLTWAIGSTNEIIWEDNSSNDVKVQLYDMTEPDVINTIAEDQSGSNYYWTINNSFVVAGHNYKIRIIDQVSGAFLDDSDQIFHISAAGAPYWGTVIQPTSNVNSTLTWLAGTANLISWNDNWSGTVKIILTDINGDQVGANPLATGVEGSTWVWNIPSTGLSGSYRIKVVSTNNDTFFAISEMPFTISNTPPTANIVVLQPNQAGLNWLIGGTYMISWEDNIAENNVTIELCTAAGASFDPAKIIASNVPGSTYLWYINDATFDPDTYTVKVKYNTASGISTEPFVISYAPVNSYIHLLQPDVDGLTWVRGNQYLISWEDNVSGSVDVYYKTGGNETLIQSNVVGSTLVWTIPGAAPIASDYKIKIYSYPNHNDVSGISANDFDVALTPAGGWITVLQPNGGEYWSVGTPYLISWNDNIPEAVDVDLWCSNTGTYETIQHGVVGTTIVWTANNYGHNTGDFKVRVKSSLVALNDESDAVFHIIVAPTQVVVYPNPATDMVNIQVNNPTDEQYTVTFTNRFNMVVLNRSYNNSQEMQISTIGIPSGIYFVTVASKSAVTTHKVIIQH